ncbi:MAG: T9SS type A sorting domain-containing protein [Flavipsychrobacter sp.]
MKLRILLSGFLMLGITTSWSQTIALDPSFDGDGIVTTDINKLNDASKAIALQVDGKIVATGYSTKNNKNEFCTIRYNVDGSIDKSFGNNGIVATAFPGNGSSLANAIAIQDNGKIIVAGNAEGMAIARYNTDGSLDGNFGNGGMVLTNNPNSTAIANSILLQPDGKIIVGGHYQNTPPDGYAYILARYNSNGSLDATFGNGGISIIDIAAGQGLGALDFLRKIVLQPNGKIIAVGVSGPNATLVRLESNGDTDSLFGINGIVTTNYSTSGNSIFNDVMIQPDGKIVAAGSTTAAVPNFLVARFNANGQPDINFGNNGAVTIGHSTMQNYATSVLLQPDGKILAGGVINDNGLFQFAIARYNSDGSVNSTFGTNGVLKTKADKSYSAIESMIMQQDNKIVVAGSNNADFLLARYTTDFPNNIRDHQTIKTMLYPNPTTNAVTLSYRLPSPNKVDIMLYTIDGRLLKVLNKGKSMAAGHQHLSFDIGDLPIGSYIIHINTGNSFSNTKLIKE